jgi:hypothetical protein
MNIIYTPSPLLKEVKFRSESLPVVIRVNKFDEKLRRIFQKDVARHRTQASQCAGYY